MMEKMMMVLARLFLGLVLFSVFAECQNQTASKSNHHRHLGCPAGFHAIAKKCYHFSTDFVDWFEAHYRCNNMNSSLVLIARSEENFQLRRFLNYHPKYGKFENWVDIRYNHVKSRWVEGSSGKALSYQSFNRYITHNATKWTWNCIILDPKRGNKWGADSCVEKNRFICQTANKLWSKCQSKKTLSNRDKQLCEKIKIANTAPAFLAVRSPMQTTHRKPPLIFLCSANMILVGRKCYHFSQQAVTWTDAHFACLQNATKLAIVNKKLTDHILRAFLNGNFIEKRERWIGGKYDEAHGRWIWAINGKPLRYQNFAENALMQNHTHHHITLDPIYKNKWNSRNVLEKKHYICQTKARRLSEDVKIPPQRLMGKKPLFIVNPAMKNKKIVFEVTKPSTAPAATIVIQSGVNDSTNSNRNFYQHD